MVNTRSGKTTSKEEASDDNSDHESDSPRLDKTMVQASTSNAAAIKKALTIRTQTSQKSTKVRKLQIEMEHFKAQQEILQQRALLDYKQRQNEMQRQLEIAQLEDDIDDQDANQDPDAESNEAENRTLWDDWNEQRERQKVCGRSRSNIGCNRPCCEPKSGSGGRGGTPDSLCVILCPDPPEGKTGQPLSLLWIRTTWDYRRSQEIENRGRWSAYPLLTKGGDAMRLSCSRRWLVAASPQNAHFTCGLRRCRPMAVYGF
ncbi:hypothetical protein ACLKA6_002579 [Drosophila palustris]